MQADPLKKFSINTQANEAESDDSSALFKHLRIKIVVLSFALLALLSTAAWYVVTKGQKRVIEHQALELAGVVSRMATTARSVYAKLAVVKLKHDGFGANIHSLDKKGFVPLPAQFLKQLGKKISQHESSLYRYNPLSRWNLEKTQGLQDDFQKWAWQQLEAQDKTNPKIPINWKPVWRIETINGRPTLRYMRADPASASSCVNCHNQMEQQADIIQQRNDQGIPAGKQWKLNQLLGAIEVKISLEKVEALAKNQRNITLYTIVGVVVLGLIFIILFLYLDIKRARDITAKLKWQAEHDDLTGLFNRNSFDHRLIELVADAKKWNNHHVMLFIDLDQFKIINDTCGHPAGDSLLQILAPKLKDIIRQSDILARLGGDEFGVLLSNCDTEEGNRIANLILKTIRNYQFEWQTQKHSISASIGLVSITPKCEDAEALMSAVDIACYVAKDKGRNRVHILTITEEEFLQLRSEMEIPTRIHKAIDNGDLLIATQHAIAVNESDAPYKYYNEVLLRLFDTEKKTIPTQMLIEAAERYNFMDRIDKWVVNQTFRSLSRGLIPLNKDSITAINISGATLNSENFVEFIIEMFEVYPEIPPNQICLEITETAAIHNLDKLQLLIKELKEYGCLFALDDFGTGLSSLSQLKHMDIDFLKIDGSFIRDVVTDHVDKAMVSSVINIGKAMGIPTVAEWVEDQAILDSITEMGVTYAQGYHIGKPEIVEGQNDEEINPLQNKKA